MSTGQSYTTTASDRKYVPKPPTGTTVGYVATVASDGSVTWGPQTSSGGAVSSASITDATTVGRAVLVASTAAVARTAIGAGTASSKADVGLGNADNTADFSKPVSAATAAALAAKYAKPGAGIPKTDLDTAVQTSLGKADTALQSAAAVPDATSTVKGAVQLTGDLGGTAASPSVVKVAGVAVSGAAVANAQLMATAPSAAVWQPQAMFTLQEDRAGYKGYTHDPVFVGATGFTPTAGTVYCSQIILQSDLPAGTTVIEYYVTVGGQGATALLNCFFGIYNDAKGRIAVSNDRQGALTGAGAFWGNVTVTTAEAHYAGDLLYVAMLVGTQATTACQMGRVGAGVSSRMTNGHATAAAPLFATADTGVTALPATLGTFSNFTSALWFAIQ